MKSDSVQILKLVQPGGQEQQLKVRTNRGFSGFIYCSCLVRYSVLQLFKDARHDGGALTLRRTRVEWLADWKPQISYWARGSRLREPGLQLSGAVRCVQIETREPALRVYTTSSTPYSVELWTATWFGGGMWQRHSYTLIAVLTWGTE
jgi:hypothetical protein